MPLAFKFSDQKRDECTNLKQVAATARDWPSSFNHVHYFYSGGTAHTARNAKSPLFPGDRPGLAITYGDG